MWDAMVARGAWGWGKGRGRYCSLGVISLKSPMLLYLFTTPNVLYIARNISCSNHITISQPYSIATIPITGPRIHSITGFMQTTGCLGKRLIPCTVSETILYISIINQFKWDHKQTKRIIQNALNPGATKILQNRCVTIDL